VQVVDGLAAVCARVGDDAEAFGQTLFLRDFCGGEHQVPQQRFMRFHGVSGGGNVFLRDDQNVRGCDRVEVAEGEALVVFKDLGGRDGSRGDTAEDAVGSHEEQCRREMRGAALFLATLAALCPVTERESYGHYQHAAASFQTVCSC